MGLENTLHIFLPTKHLYENMDNAGTELGREGERVASTYTICVCVVMGDSRGFSDVTPIPLRR